MLKRVQHDGGARKSGDIAWPFIRTVRATLRRPELVSGPMPRWRRQVGCIQSRTNSAAWMLKRVQHDGGARKSGDIAWPFIRTARATLRRPELVSGPMPRWRRHAGCIQSRASSEAWMLKRVQHDGRGCKSGDIAWPIIRTFRATRPRRPELVSGPMPRWGRQSGWSQSRANSVAWMLKRVQHDGRGCKSGDIAWPFIRTVRATRPRRPELVSGPMPRWGRQAGWSQSRTNSAAWMLKRVQGDGRSGSGGAFTPARLPFNQSPFNPQIPPLRVILLDQVDLPLPVPSLQLLLARNRVGHPVKRFGVHQADRAIIRRKTWRRSRAVLVQSRCEVRCHADVKRSAFLAGEDIGAGLPHMDVGNIQRRHAELVSASMPRIGRQAGCVESISSSEAWVLKRVQDDGRCGDCNA
jgi:hypothetical protein